MRGELRHKKKEKFTLDKFADIGIFKDSKPDIADIWSEQRSMRSQQIKLDKKQQDERKQQLKALPRLVAERLAPHRKAIIYLIVMLLTVLVTRATIFSEKDNKATLGVVSSNQQGVQNDDGRTDEQPDFDTLSPSGRSDLQSVTRKTPTGTWIVTFADTIENIDIEVTQQKLPDNFKSAPAAELQKIATNFQATDLIQIDDAVVYHGLNERTGVQSLFTIRKDILISIRANQKISDDSWAGYLLSLN